MSRSDRRPESEGSEAEYLAREIAESRAALVHTAEELKESLCESVNLSQWIRRYPWAALGVASVTGFTVAAVVTPRPGQTFGDRLSELVARRSEQVSAPVEPASETQARKASTVRPSRSILESLFGLVKLLIETLIVAAIRASASPPIAQQRDK